MHTMHTQSSALSKQNNHHSCLYPAWWKKSHTGGKKKYANRMKVERLCLKCFPMCVFLANVPTDKCPFCLRLWLLRLGSLSLDLIWFLIHWCIKCLASPCTSLSAAGQDQHHLRAWRQSSISYGMAIVRKNTLLFLQRVSSALSGTEERFFSFTNFVLFQNMAANILRPGTLLH